MIELYTSNTLISQRLEKMELEYHLLSSETLIDGALILCCPEEFSDIQQRYKKIKIFVLSQQPSFVEGSPLLQKEARGYGNVYMQKIHFLQALKTIKNDAIWIYPEMMHELILLGTEAMVSNEAILDLLSQREKEVAQQIEKGLSNKEIAIALGITERTVKAHLSSVYEKLEVNDRLALAMLLRK